MGMRYSLVSIVVAYTKLLYRITKAAQNCRACGRLSVWTTSNGTQQLDWNSSITQPAVMAALVPSHKKVLKSEEEKEKEKETRRTIKKCNIVCSNIQGALVNSFDVIIEMRNELTISSQLPTAATISLAPPLLFTHLPLYYLRIKRQVP